MRILILILCVMFARNLYSQKLELTQQDKQELEYRAGRMVKLFTTSLETIPGFSGEPILKDKAIQNTLALFVKDATIELLLASGERLTKTMPVYLNSLREYKNKGSLVNIEVIDFTVDKIKKDPKKMGRYIVEFKFVQIFRKKKNYTPDPLATEGELRELEWDYVDRTEKSGVAYVKKVTTRHGTKLQMLLGNVEADNVEVLK
jgi:hypothetical protein